MQNVSSVLDAVTVFSKGALCSRVAQVKAESGRLPSRVKLVGLPLLLKTGSLRASVRKGPEGLVVRDVRPELDVVRASETDLPTEQKELEAAEEALARTEADLAVVTGDIDAVRRLEPTFLPPAKGAPPRPSSAPAILELASFVEASLETLHARLFQLQDVFKAQSEEVELRRQRIREASSSNQAQRIHVTRAAVVTLSDVASAEPVELFVEYVVMGAKWAPAYELDLGRGMDSGMLKLRANVVQRTGEDWNDVRLSLSTANLDRRADAPELKSLRIGRRQQTPARSGWREPPPGLDELFIDFDVAQRSRPATPVRSDPVAATRTMAGTLSNYDSLADAAVALGRSMPPPAPPRAAAPMPMAQAMPAPKSAPRGASRMKKARAQKQLSVDDAPDEAPMADFEEGAAPVEMARRSRAPTSEFALGEMASGGGGFGSDSDEGATDAAMEVDAAVLEYSALELPSPTASGRGKLQRRQGPLHHDLIVLQAVNVQVNVTSMIAVLQHQADAVLDAPLPKWSVVPRDAAAFFDYRYDVAARTSLASDGVWHSLPVFVADVAMQGEYLAVPSVEPRAFRTVKLTNKTPHALLQGPIDVRLGGEFLMTAPFPTIAPGATQRLGLGVEEAIKVSRNTRYDEATGGVFGGATVLTHGVDVEVANRLSHPVTLDVRERVPAIPPSEKDIKVEESEVRPVWSKPTALPGDVPVEGERSWRVQLKAGEKQKLTANVVVRIPASKMLQGGNRRG